MDNLEDMQIRVRLLQTELTALRQTLSEREAALAQQAPGEVTVQDQLTALQQQLDALPASLSSLCLRGSPLFVTVARRVPAAGASFPADPAAPSGPLRRRTRACPR